MGVRRRQNEVIGMFQQGAQVARRVERVDAFDRLRWIAPGTDYAHIEAFRKPRDFTPDLSQTDDGHRFAGKLSCCVALPVTRFLLALQVFKVLLKEEHRKDDKLGKRAGMDAAGGREQPVGAL